MLFKLAFINNIILSCFFFFFWLIDLHFLIASVISQIYDATVEFVIPIGIQTKEAKAETKMDPVTADTEIKKYSTYFRVVQTF